MPGKTSIEELAALLTQPHRHLEVALVNDHAVYVVRFLGAFPCHSHTRDEMYLVLDGELRIEFPNEPSVVLQRNESAVVRAYTTHSTVSEKGALALMVKPREMFAPGADVETRTE